MRTSLDISSALADLAAELRGDIPGAVERGLARIREEAPDYVGRGKDPDLATLNRQSYVQQLRFIYAGLASGRTLDGRSPPALALEEARTAALLGIKLSSLLRSCRVAQRLLFEDVVEKSGRLAADPALRAAVLRATARWLFSYFDWVTIAITNVYQRERDLVLRGRDRRRRMLVGDLLDGQPVDPGALGYELKRDHLAIIAWGYQPERAVLALRNVTGFALLTVAGPDATTWAWLGAARIGADEERAIRDYTPPAGTYLAVGEPAPGPEGFRLSHRQAHSAQAIRRRAPRHVTMHADVALLALTLQDDALAQRFMSQELGPLSADDERSRTLCTTLNAYFASGQNAASTAAALGVHSRTILYRLRSIEERLGHPIGARREELGVALRLREILTDGA